MSARFKAVCIQTNSASEIPPNLEAAGAAARQARAEGAELILFPENVAAMEADKELLRAKAEPEARHRALEFFRGLARETGAWILAGSLAVKLEDGLLANRSFLIGVGGEIAARYDKIHMFDVDIEGGESHRESATFRPGEEVVVAQTPWGLLGLTVCYDLRFPWLYRALAKAGASMIAVPSAFTRLTGRAHWHVLLRARAIETGSFILAPAQCGEHAGGRQTYGHSLIVDPWGEILAEAGEAPGSIAAEIDLGQSARVRAMIPALDHARETETPPAAPETKPARRRQ